MLKIRLKSGGHIVDIGKSFPYRLIKADGLDSCDFDIALGSSALYDGGYLTKSRIEPREIDISFDMSNDEGLRRQMIKLFTPHSDVEITVTRFDVSRRIVGRVSSCSIKQNSIFELQTVSLSFICPDPYFYDVSALSAAFCEKSGLVRLQTALPFGGMAVGAVSERDRVVLSNSGDSSCGFSLTISVTAPINYLRIVNAATDEYLLLTHGFEAGDSIAVCTLPGKKRVTLNGSDCLQYLDCGSVFFSLRQGETPLRILSSQQDIAFNACVSFEQIYLGV